MTVYFWLGAQADTDPEVIDALIIPQPLVVVDTRDSEAYE